MKKIPTPDTKFNLKNGAAFEDMGESAYRLADGLNKSLLVSFIRSPRHYLAALQTKKEPTDSMNIGSALHAELLQSRPSDVYATMKKVDARTSEGKAYKKQFAEENSGKIVIDEAQAEHVMGMKNALLENPIFKRQYEKVSHKEFALFGYKTCQHGDVRLKGMLDAYCESDGVILDIKTSRDASLDSFKWDFKSFRYDLQQIHYTYLLSGLGFNYSKFIFAVVENTPPYEVSFHTLSFDQYRRSFDEWVLHLDFFSKCKSSEDFNVGYPQVVNELSF